MESRFFIALSVLMLMVCCIQQSSNTTTSTIATTTSITMLETTTTITTSTTTTEATTTSITTTTTSTSSTSSTTTTLKMTNRCRSCEECNEKLNAMKFLTVYLDEDLDVETGECIRIEVSGMRFDCKGHTIQGDGTGTGIKVLGKSGRGYSGNEIKNCVVKNFDKGIEVYYLRDALIMENTLSENTIGLYLFNSDSSTIEENEITENKDYGIDLVDSRENEVNSNVISSNGGGINIQQTSSGNKINSNTIQSNTYGVYIKSADSNELNENEITWNTLYGVYLYNSVVELEENTICYNGDNDITGEFYNESVGRRNKCGKDSDWDDKTTSGCMYSC